VFTWANGNQYKGFYLNDMREGEGTMKWSDGTIYNGEWVQGQ
jgi:hypothetical protein